MDEKREAPQIRYRKPRRYRQLGEIYAELGHTYRRRGEQLMAQGAVDQAMRLFADAVRAFQDALREAPQTAELYLYLAENHKALGQSPEALRAYLTAVILEPSRAAQVLPEAHHLLTPDLAASLGDLEQKLASSIDEVPQDVETHAVIYNFLGRLGVYKEDYPGAISYYRRAQEVRPESLYVLQGLSEALWLSGEAALALETIRQAVNIADRQVQYAHQISTRLKWVEYLLGLLRYEEAIQAIQEGLALDPGASPEFHLALSKCYLGLKRSDEALLAIDKILELGSLPEKMRLEAYTIRSAALVDLGRFDSRWYKEADQAAQEALKLDPTHHLAVRSRAQALIDGRLDLERGIRLLQVYLQQRPEDLAAQRLLVSTMREQGRPPAEVVEALQRAIDYAPESEQVSLLLELAEAYNQEDRAAEAISVLDEIAVSTPEALTARWWLLKGDALQKLSKKEDALECYRQGLRVEAQDAQLLRRQAELLSDIGEPAEAGLAWQAVVENAPRDSQAQLKLAHMYLQQGAFQEALAAVDLALASGLYDQQEVSAYELRAEILQALSRPKSEVAEALYEAGRRSYWEGDYPKAVKHFEAANRLDKELQLVYWYWVDTLRLLSHLPEPKRVDRKFIRKCREVWEKGTRKKLPDADSSWAYSSLAQVCEQEGFLPGADKIKKWWESVVCLEQAILLYEADSYRWALLGGFHRVIENNAVALDAVSRALEYAPDDVSVLEQRAAILANLGELEEGLKAIDRRRELAPSLWADTLKAYMLLRAGRHQEAVEILDGAIRDEPGNLWYYEMRAYCLTKLDQTPQARKDYEWIWSKLDDLDYGESQDSVGWAAYSLGTMENVLDLKYIDQAAQVFETLIGHPVMGNSAARGLGLCCMLKGDLERGKALLLEGIQQVKSVWYLEELLDNFREIEEMRPEAGVRQALDQLREAIESHRGTIAKPVTPEEELNSILKELGEPEERGWKWIGAQAGLARYYLEQERWDEAALAYRGLQAIQDRFHQARAGLEKVVLGLASSGDQHIRSQEPRLALELYEKGFRLVMEHLGEDPTQQAALLGRMTYSKAYAHFILGELQEARTMFLGMIDAFQRAGLTDAGVYLGNGCLDLIQEVDHYWELDEEWQTLAGLPETGEHHRQQLAAARETLEAFLEGAFQLAGTDVQSDMLYVKPIGLDLEEGLIPEDTSTQTWPLFTTFIPAMRRRIQEDTGIRVPGVNVRQAYSGTLPPGGYTIYIDEVKVTSRRVAPEHVYALTHRRRLEKLGIPGEDILDAADSDGVQEGCWVPQVYRGQLGKGGVIYWIDPLQYVVSHMEVTLRRNLQSFVSVQETANLLETWKQDEKLPIGMPALIQAALPDQTALLRFTRLLGALTREGIPLILTKEILEVVKASGLAEDLDETLRVVRMRLKKQLPGNQPGVERLNIPPGLEAKMSRWVQRSDGRQFLAAPASEIQAWADEIQQLLSEYDREIALVVENPALRLPVWHLVSRRFPGVAVLSGEEALANLE